VDSHTAPEDTVEDWGPGEPGEDSVASGWEVEALEFSEEPDVSEGDPNQLTDESTGDVIPAD
jgi:hypothetical protein